MNVCFLETRADSHLDIMNEIIPIFQAKQVKAVVVMGKEVLDAVYAFTVNIHCNIHLAQFWFYSHANLGVYPA